MLVTVSDPTISFALVYFFTIFTLNNTSFHVFNYSWPRMIHSDLIQSALYFLMFLYGCIMVVRIFSIKDPDFQARPSI